VCVFVSFIVFLPSSAYTNTSLSQEKKTRGREKQMERQKMVFPLALPFDCYMAADTGWVA